MNKKKRSYSSIYYNGENMNFEIIIPIAKTDIEALKNSLPYIHGQFQNRKISIIANKEIEKEFGKFEYLNFIDENEMIDGLNFIKVKELLYKRYPKSQRRTGWYFQQFLKLGYAYISNCDYYLSWDSDTLPLVGKKMFDDKDRPYLDCVECVKEDYPYFETIKKIWPDGTVKNTFNKSFITEHMMFNVKIVRCMLNEILNNDGLEGKTFFEKIINAIPVEYLNLSGFSEFETYAAFVISKKQDEYVIRNWKNLRHGKIFFGDNPSGQELNWAKEKFDVVSIEDFDHQWIICKLLNNILMKLNVSFDSYFKFINPFIRIVYSIRMKMRKILRK